MSKLLAAITAIANLFKKILDIRHSPDRAKQQTQADVAEAHAAAYEGDQDKINHIAATGKVRIVLAFLIVSLSLVGCTSSKPVVYVPSDRTIVPGKWCAENQCAEPTTNSVVPASWVDGMTVYIVPAEMMAEFLECKVRAEAPQGIPVQ